MAYVVMLGCNSLKKVIVDSGTTLIIVPYWIMDPIKKIFTGLCSSNPLVGICNVQTGKSLFDGECYSMTAKQVASFPSMSFSFTVRII